MARIIGTLAPPPRRGLIASVSARLSESSRLETEAHAGEGMRRLLPLLEKLPESVTILLRPKLGFMSIDCCAIGPGRFLALQPLHWSGPIGPGEKGNWVGKKVDLGRPDRTTSVFCDRLSFAGHARGFELEAAVVVTAGPVALNAPLQSSRLIQWAEAEAFLQGSFPAGVVGFDASALIQVLSGQGGG